MKTNKQINEAAQVNMEILDVTSAAGSTSLNYDMQHFDKALIAVNVQGGYSTVTVDLMESSAATVAGTSAAGSKAGMVLGGASTAISTSGGVRSLTLTLTTASTVNDTIRFTENGVSKTFTNINTTASLNSSAWTSTSLYFGSTVGSTAATGLQLRVDSLITALNNSTYGYGTGLICSTGTTATVTITARDGFDGGIGYGTTLAAYTALVNEAVGAFHINADQMTSTLNKRYIGAKVSTASTSLQAAVTVIRAGGSYMPPVFAGKLST